VSAAPIILLLVISAWQVEAGGVKKHIPLAVSEETPKYDVVHTASSYNIRRYEPHLLAETNCDYAKRGRSFQVWLQADYHHT
jgi:hypothetical protein